jgi:hypothetical protein
MSVVYGKRETYWDITLIPILNRSKKAEAIMSIAMAQTMARQLGGEIISVKVKRGARFELLADIGEV